jgi:putative Holliday junction resolvase
MIIMSVDLGKARTGIAISDSGESFAFPKKVITEYNTQKLIGKVCDSAKEFSAELIVVGLPKNMDGTEGFRAEHTRLFAQKLQTLLPELPMEFYDERLSTVAASRFMMEANTKGKKKRAVIDALSAQIILQDYIDRNRK